MSDTSGHDAPERDDLHTMTLGELEAQIIAAGIVMSRRQIMRHCKGGTFDAQKLPAANNLGEWFISPASVEKGIADIKVLHEHRARRDQTRRVATGDVRVKDVESVVPGHDATKHDVSKKENDDSREVTQPDTPRHDASDLDIFEHPYVKRLEERLEKSEAKYEQQVRRTEEIQLKNQEQLLELQRMTAVGNSQTLADFMLKAKDWMIGRGTEPDTREVRDTSSS